jgi:O-antigen ligase
VCDNAPFLARDSFLSLTGLAFLVAFAIGCLMAFARHPAYGWLTYVGVFFLNPPSRWWGQGFLLDFRWALIAAAVTLLAMLIHRRKLPPAIPFLRHGVALAYVAFIIWLGVQKLWALDPVSHHELFVYYIKFGLVLYLGYRCMDAEKHLHMFLWVHVLGCFYFGWIAFTSYEGGRFEDFGGPGLSEANAGALTIVTGVLAAGALLLVSKNRQRVILILMIPIIVNALVTTISRSGFLAAGLGGIIFNFFAPGEFRKRIRVFSILALVMFGMLAGPAYWERIRSIEKLGEEVEGVDTGAGRLVIMAAQMQMFADHPLGCGATCTAVLSSQYMDDKHLVGEGAERARASHNTFFTMLVEHGIPGATFYVFVALWILKTVRKLWRALRQQSGLLPTALPAFAGMAGAVFMCDMFATYAKFEVRIWIIAGLMAMWNLTASAAKSTAPEARGSTGEEKGRLPSRRAALPAARRV